MEGCPNLNTSYWLECYLQTTPWGQDLLGGQLWHRAYIPSHGALLGSQSPSGCVLGSFAVGRNTGAGAGLCCARVCVAAAKHCKAMCPSLRLFALWRDGSHPVVTASNQMRVFFMKNLWKFLNFSAKKPQINWQESSLLLVRKGMHFAHLKTHEVRQTCIPPKEVFFEANT